MINPSSLRLTMARTRHFRPSPLLASIRQPTSLKPFHNAARLAYPRKGSEDKDSINRESTEYSKSGTDDQAAAMEEAAFDPSKTKPEEQKKMAGKGNAVSASCASRRLDAGFVRLLLLYYLSDWGVSGCKYGWGCWGNGFCGLGLYVKR